MIARVSILSCEWLEVKVPLKQSDNPDDGFWADAKEIVSLFFFFGRLALNAS